MAPNEPIDDANLAQTTKSLGGMSAASRVSAGSRRFRGFDPATHGPTGMPIGTIRLMTVLILMMRIGSHYDGGALAALYGDDEERMENELDLSSSMQGLIVTVGYVGLVIGCIAAVVLIKRFPTKTLLMCSMVILAVGCLLFATASHLWMLMLGRVCVGLGQALQTVLYPVWADEFAPVKSASAYLAALQAGGPLGIVIGFLVTGFVQNNTDLSWRWTFYFQIFWLVPVFIIFALLVKAEYVDISPQKDKKAVEEMRARSTRAASTCAASEAASTAHDDEEDEEEDPEKERSWKALKVVATNGFIVSATLVLASLYFVVNGLQTWVVDYVGSNESNVDADENTVVGAFGFTAATGPVSGIVFGGWLLARLGGYRKFPSRTTFAGVIQGVLAVAFAYASLMVHTFGAFIGMIWMLLFFGGSMVPGLVGLYVSSVRRSYRAMASSFAGFIYNLLGYALGPLVGGVVADQFEREEEGSVWGFRVIIGFSAMSLILQLCIYLFCLKNKHLEPMSEDRPLFVDMDDADDMSLISPAPSEAGDRRKKGDPRE
eukprot:TRINITY_DN4816_c2_g1_i2.p1 TRINITY_DN4816_c2_g1~~TRINITY_DN4816_c2_g1_i2.p1  ORF type:complete len:546 (+),score=203.10 TRINITY_DN4816_c2_g1_i2:59-1696(+)